MNSAVNIFWFRRDLRLHDNHGLYKALSAGLPVIPLFIFDSDILNKLEERDDRRVAFIHDAIVQLQKILVAAGSTLEVRYGSAQAVFAHLLSDYTVHTVFCNHDYEPYARKRDDAIAMLLQQNGVSFSSYKDQVIFEQNEITKNDGLPYGMYTPYSKKWKAQLTPEHTVAYPSENLTDNFLKQEAKKIIALEQMNFVRGAYHFPTNELGEQVVVQYHQQRDFPAIAGTTRMGVHLRFGTISIRQLVKSALQLNTTFLGELIWREFFMQLLWHYPRLEKECSKKEYEAIRWRDDEKGYAAWCAGQTGYPIVDAGMRELNATGFMHNRVRMVAASFLVKHLLIDWRLGEDYFARRLLDFELAANNGNWQWVAGCGCDAAPYFRIFNPMSQAKKFDGQDKYIRRWVPEYGTAAYATPIVVHEAARSRCLAAYKEALQAKYQAQSTNRLFAD